MSRLSSFLLLLSLAACALAAVPSCDVATLPTTIAGLKDPEQDPVAFIYAEGFRLYDCTSGTPSPKSGGLVNITDGGPSGTSGTDANWTGYGVYPDSDGNGTFVMTDASGTGFNLTLDYSTVEFIPAPDGTLEWARWDAFSVPENLQANLGFGWASRVDTKGGAAPENCEKAVDGESIVPYTAYYYFYPCPTGSGPALAPVPAPPAPPSAAFSNAKNGVVGAAAAVALAVGFLV